MRRELEILILLLSPLSLFANQTLLEQDFDHRSPGSYTIETLREDWPGLDWGKLMDRAFIVETPTDGQGRALEVVYPAGSVGPQEGGAQFVVSLPPAQEYWLQYAFRMDPNFDFQLGGKLPGLTSGGAKYTGGHRPDKGQGWSARFMWREHGKMVLYLYSIDMHGKWGDDHELKMPPLERGRWFKVVQRIRINDAEKHNAEVEVWVDDEQVLNLENIRLRLGKQGKIDTFYFSTFFGGNTPKWGPDRESRIQFDNFRVWRE